jgi:hypothetical protein
MAKINQKTKMIIFGMIGALIGAWPISILKNIFALMFDGYCTSIVYFRNLDFDLATCGLISNLSWAYLFFILFGGALFGFLSDLSWLRSPQKQGIDPSIQNEKNVFGQSFVAGLLFDLLFVIISMAFM